MTRFHSQAAAVALLGAGLVELAASAAGRSVVDRVGRVVVDTTPLPVVEQAVRLTGTTDKPLLRATLVAGAAAGAGLVADLVTQHRHDTRAIMPSPAGAVAAAAGLAAYTAGRRRLDRRRATQDEQRRPVEATEPLPARTDGAETWPHAEPLFTDIEDFYATDVNLRPPLVDRDTWRLQLSAAGRSTELSLDGIRALDLHERDALLICVHNRLGWDRLGHQRWTGLPVADVFAAAGVPFPDDLDGHDLVMEAVDGYRQVMPLPQVVDRQAWVVVGMGGRELPAAHGFPARVLTPGVVGQYNGTKWLQRLTVVPRGSVTATWVDRGWPRQTVVPPPMARIDHPGQVRMPPRPPQGVLDVAADTTFVGTAWAPAHGGVATVELRVDDGPWQPAELAEDLGAWSWRRWRATPGLRPGRHTVAVRCTTHDGTVQSATPRQPFPYGATGHHTLGVRVS